MRSTRRISKAKAVAQSLALDPYFKVLGGHIREEPVDRSTVEHDAKLTDVDKAVRHWFMREFCRRCSLEKRQLLYLGKGFNEFVDEPFGCQDKSCCQLHGGADHGSSGEGELCDQQ